MHSIDKRAAACPASVPFLNISFVIGLFTSFLAATSSHSDAAEGAWRERYMGYQTSSRRDKAPAKPEAALSGPLFAVVSIGDQRVSLYGSGGLAARSSISSGMRGHPTPTGVFSIVQKQRWHESNIYSGAPMPFMQRITWSGIAMHAGVLPGYAASHGCIRLPASFAQRIFGATEIGQRVMVAPRDAVPSEIAHKTLPSPLLQPAPAGTPIAAADDARVTAALDEPQGAEGGALEKVSIADAPSDPKPLNPLDFARALKRQASAQAREATRSTKAAILLNATKVTELRLATRRLSMAQSAAASAEDKITASIRKVQKAESDVAAAKAADAKTVEAKLAEVKAAEVKAAEAKAVETKAADAKAAEINAAEAKTAEAKAAEAKVAEAKAAESQAVEAMAAETKAAEAFAAEAKAAAADAKAADAQTADASASTAKATDAGIAEANVIEVKPETGAALEGKRNAAEEARKATEQARKSAEEAGKVAEAARKTADRAGKAADAAFESAKDAAEEAEDARSDADKAQKAAELRAIRLQDALTKANEAKTAAEAALTDARKSVEEARAVIETRQQEAVAARRAAEEAKTASHAAAQSLAEANRRLKPLSVFISRKTGRLYVRQDFKPLFDAAVTIGNPERPIGTHLYVSTSATQDGATLKWQAVTMPFLEPEAKDAARDRKRSRSGDGEAAAASGPVAAPEHETAAGALDRIAIPEETVRRLAELAWVGAAVIVSDNGISGETGETTDFIILTRSRASAP